MPEIKGFNNHVNLLLNPCIPQKYIAPSSPSCTSEDDDDKYIIGRELKDCVVKTGDKDVDFVLDKKVVEISRVDRQEYIESFADDVGILNIMKKVALTGDTSLLNQRSRVPGEVDEDGLEKVNDITGLNDPEAIRTDLSKADKMLNMLPEDLRNALACMSDDELKAFVEGKISEAKASAADNDKKDGE